jgi:gluconate 2-dehydrogenase gamma chain
MEPDEHGHPELHEPEIRESLDPPISRRRFLVISAAAAGALALGGELAACGNTTGSTSSSTTTAGGAASTGTTAAAASTTTMAGMGDSSSTTTGHGGQGAAQRFAQPLQILSAAQAALLATVVDRLIPADTTGPSGSQAGVVGYIDGALQQETDRGDSFLGNLDAIQTFAQQAQGGDFASLAGDKQDAVLGAIQTGKATGFAPNSTLFFLALREYTLEGMFSDPVYGGNRGFAGWHLIGFPGIRLTVTADDQKLDVKPNNVDKSAYDYNEFGFVVQGG